MNLQLYFNRSEAEGEVLDDAEGAVDCSIGGLHGHCMFWVERFAEGHPDCFRHPDDLTTGVEDTLDREVSVDDGNDGSECMRLLRNDQPVMTVTCFERLKII